MTACRIQPRASGTKPTACLRSLNEALQILCADVYSQFASRKLNNVAK